MAFLLCLLAAQAEYSRAAPEPPFSLAPAQTSDIALTAEIQARKDRIKTFFEAIEKGNIEAVKTALAAHPDLVSGRDYYGWSPLQSALSSRKIEVAKLLIEQGADFKNPLAFESSALGSAINSGDLEFTRWLIEKGAAINAPPRSDYSPLQRAMQQEKPDFLKMLVDKGVDLRVSDSKGRTPLHWMIENGYGGLDSIKMLVDKGGDINARDDEGKTPLFKVGFRTVIADRNGSYHSADGALYRDAVMYLIGKGGDINARARNGNTPFHEAALSAYSNRILDLLAVGADPNLKNNRGNLPLHLVLQNGGQINPQPLKALVEKTDLSLRNGQGLSPLLLALQQYLPAARDLIVARRAPDDTIEKFFDAAAQNDIATLGALAIKDRWLAQTRLPDGSTPLHIASLWSASDAIKTLIQSGAEVSARDSSWRTPLHRAIRAEPQSLKKPDVVQAVKTLLTRRADLSAADENGSTPLHVAANLKNFAIIEAILNGEPSVALNWGDKDGKTPLLLALENAQPETVKIAQLLLDKGADINARSNNGLTPLAQAARTDNVAILTILLDKGADINEGGEVTPLGNAVNSSAKAAAQFLLEKGADFNRPSSGESLLERAIYNDMDDLARALIEKGIDVNARYGSYQTPLTRAVMRNKKDLLALLLQKGADVNATNSEGKTALQIAQREAKTELIELLQKNADKK